LPNVWVVFVIILYEGLLGGSAYVNAFYNLRQEETPDKEFSLGLVSVADSFGICLAAVTAIFVEPQLLQIRKSRHGY